MIHKLQMFIYMCRTLAVQSLSFIFGYQQHSKLSAADVHKHNQDDNTANVVGYTSNAFT